MLAVWVAGSCAAVSGLTLTLWPSYQCSSSVQFQPTASCLPAFLRREQRAGASKCMCVCICVRVYVCVCMCVCHSGRTHSHDKQPALRETCCCLFWSELLLQPFSGDLNQNRRSRVFIFFVFFYLFYSVCTKHRVLLVLPVDNERTSTGRRHETRVGDSSRCFLCAVVCVQFLRTSVTFLREKLVTYFQPQRRSVCFSTRSEGNLGSRLRCSPGPCVSVVGRQRVCPRCSAGRRADGCQNDLFTCYYTEK